MKIGLVLLKLLPIARDLVKAAKKDSPGGKKITPGEVAEIVLKHLDAVADEVSKL